MDAVTPAKKTSQQKCKNPIPVASPRSHAEPDPFSLITPDKQSQLPRRTRNRGVALSVKEVREITQGLHRGKKESSRQSLIARLGNDILVDDVGLAADTVQKPSKRKDDVKLPEKYEILVEFFECLESSIRLLRLKRSMTTFTNIYPKIESLTDRRFLHGHLAQLKYLLPEAIHIKKILVQDERTLCMKPDLLISLQLDAAVNGGDCKSGSGYLVLRKMFRSQLTKWFKAHPEGDEVPEEILPEPFNAMKPKLSMPSNAIDRTNLPPQSSEILLQRPSHMSQSFKPRFSQKKISLPELAKADLKLPAGPVNLVTSSTLNLSTDKKLLDLEICTPLGLSTSNPSPSSCSHVELFPSSPCKIQEEHTTMKGKDHDAEKVADDIIGTPAKLLSTPLKLIGQTPELPSSKRRCFSPSSPYNLPKLPNRFTRNSNTIKALEFNTRTKNSDDAENDTGISTVDEDIHSLLPENLWQSLREKEKKAMEEKDKGLAKVRRRQQMIQRLPQLFNTVHLIFQSVKRSVLTQQELIYKIYLSNYEIADQGEIEEQLKLLQELVPDWISGKMSLSGDFLICLNKISCPEEIRGRLEEAE